MRANAEISAIQLLAPHHTSDDAASARTHIDDLSFGSVKRNARTLRVPRGLPALILGGVVSTAVGSGIGPGGDRSGHALERSAAGARWSAHSLGRGDAPRGERTSAARQGGEVDSGGRAPAARQGTRPRISRGAPSRARPELEPASRCEAPQSRRRRQRPPASSRCVLKNSHAAAVASISSRAHACTRPSTRTSRTSASQPL